MTVTPPPIACLLARTLALVMGIASAAGAGAQTASNACGYDAGNQYPVSNACNFLAFNKPGTFTSHVTPSGCNGSGNNDAWGWFTAIGTTTTITYAPNSSTNPILHVFSGACNNLVQLACANATGSGESETLTITTVVGQNYLVRVQRSGSNSAMNGTLCIQNAPANNHCGGSIALPVTEACFSQNFTNAGATHSPSTPTPNCGGTFNATTARDVWFHFTAPPSGVVYIETTAGSLTNANMQLYSGNCNSLVRVECNTNSGPGDMPYIDRRCNPLTPGVVYRIRVWGASGAQGTFNICVRGFDWVPIPPEDCQGGVTICGDASIQNNSTSTGCVADLNSSNRGCLAGNERQGTWYYFSPSASGTIAMDIIPAADIDYDFAIWGPLTTITCPPAGTPTRCTWAYPPNVPGYPAATSFWTGMRAGATQTSQGSNSNGYVLPLNVVAGDLYIMYIDNFDITGQSFQLDWHLSNGASLACTILPVELVHFEARVGSGFVELGWTTQTENNSDHFVVERASDAMEFFPLGTVAAAGHSLGNINYRFVDEAPLSGNNNYRLKKVDNDGSFTYTEIRVAHYRDPRNTLTLHPNPANDLINLSVEVFDLSEHSVNIIDASGRRLWQRQFSLAPGKAKLDLVISDLDAGTYLVQVVCAGGLIVGVARFVKH